MPRRAKSFAAVSAGPSEEEGFTLVELMIGVSIIAMLLLLALPNYREWLQNSQIRTAADSIQNGLQLARANALQSNERVQFALNANGDWTVSVVSSGATVQRGFRANDWKNVAITRLPAATTTVTFDSFGRVVANADGTGTPTRFELDLPSAVLAADKTRELRIDVLSGGLVRRCDPAQSNTPMGCPA